MLPLGIARSKGGSGRGRRVSRRALGSCRAGRTRTFCSFDQFRWPEVAATSYGSVDGVDVKEVCVGRVGCESEGIIECLECELVLVER